MEIEKKSKPLVIILLSTAIFLLNYLVVVGVYQLLVFAFSYSVGYFSEFSYLKITFTPEFYNATLIYKLYILLLPLIVLLVLAIILFDWILSKIDKEVFDLFFLWFSIVIFNFFASQFYVSLFYLFTEIEQLNYGLSTIFYDLEISISLAFAISIIMSIALCIVGYVSANIFFGLFLNSKNNNLESLYVGKYYVQQIFLIPFLIGSIFILFLQNDDTKYVHFINLFPYPIFGIGLFIVKKNMPFRFKYIPNVFVEIPNYFPLFVLAFWALIYFLS